MSATVSARIVDLASDGLVNSHATQPFGPRGQKEALALSRLNIILQTSIELSEIIRLFFTEVRRILPLDGLSFEHRIQQICIQQGIQEGRSSHYRIQTDSDYLGNLTLFRQGKKFTQADLETLDRLISSLVFPLRNGLRYQEAVKASLTDGLTGTGNRISLDSVLSQEVEQSSRYGHPLSIMILDLDHFKVINDSHGHSVGDRVLKAIADTIRNSSRNADMTFRYGGEEFVVVLNKTDAGGAKVGAERIRRIIEQLTIEVGDLCIPVTASIGVASLGHGEPQEELLRRADSALYSAKRNGRNQVMVAEPGLSNA